MNLGDIISLIFGELYQMKSLNKTELLFNVEATFVKKEQHVFEILAGSDTFFESASTKNGREVRFLYLTCMITLILSQKVYCCSRLKDFYYISSLLPVWSLYSDFVKFCKNVTCFASFRQSFIPVIHLLTDLR